jgi:hypothetical protein
MSSRPSSTTDPEMTVSPGLMCTGTDSPDIELWLTEASPSATVPSMGTSSPAPQTTTSPSRTSEAGISLSTPSRTTHTVSAWGRKRPLSRAVERFSVLSSR